MAVPGIGTKILFGATGAAPNVTKNADGGLCYNGKPLKVNALKDYSVHVQRTLIALAIIGAAIGAIGALSYFNMLQIASPIGTIGMGHAMGPAFWMMAGAGAATVLSIALIGTSAGIRHAYPANPPKEVPV